MNLPPYLPMSDDKALVLDIMNRGDAAPAWASSNLLARMRNQGLLQRDGGTHTITDLGKTVAKVVASHGYSTTYAHPGRIGTKGRCRCGGWTWSTNENGHDGKRLVRSAFAAHLVAEVEKIQEGSR